MRSPALHAEISSAGAAAPGESNTKPKTETGPGHTTALNNSPREGDDTLTGFDLFSGHLETLSGRTFLVYREAERSTADMWKISGELSGQPQVHFICKPTSDCTIENTTNKQVVHGRVIR
jgi:hypothetical protein